jgi:hypothetical protein
MLRRRCGSRTERAGELRNKINTAEKAAENSVAGVFVSVWRQSRTGPLPSACRPAPPAWAALHQSPSCRPTPEGPPLFRSTADGVGAFNKRLSERRAGMIKEYLVDIFQLSASNLRAVGYGKSRLNRRGHPIFVLPLRDLPSSRLLSQEASSRLPSCRARSGAPSAR